MPKDPVMLLSYINTQLRDFYGSLEAFCQDKGAEQGEIVEKLRGIDYEYDSSINQFI